MKLTVQRSFAAAIRLGISFAWLWMSVSASAQGMTTTTVQGTVYLANGRTGSGTLQVSWPAFTTAGNQAVTAGRTNVTIGGDGYVSVKLAPNLGSTPAGLYYTAVYHLSDGTTSTEYWVVPAAAQASLAQIRAQVMPAAQAVQAVNKGYVDQSIAELTQSLLTASGGTLSGPLYLNGDPTQTQQAATKHYVDAEFANAVPMSGAALTGPLTSVQLGAAYQVDQFPGADFGARLQACLSKLNVVYGGTCDARNFSGTLGMSSALVIATANATVQLPCATIATANQIRVTAGTRNVTLRGCALRGARNESGSEGGTVFLYSGSGPLMQVGDPSYTSDTPGFHLDNAVINTTVSASASAQGLAAYRTQEINLQGLYFLGNSNQTGMTLDGTGNYTGGTFQDLEFGGFGTAVNAIGHQVSNAASTDWLNASTFLRLHINCPTGDGIPVAGTYGINLQQGDGNTFTGGDVEGCGTALHLGPNAQNNTIVGLRNENSISQVVADAGSAYNNWITGGTMFTGKLTDNGTRNSFLDTFHRSFNGLNGDWYGSQKDATVTNHYRIGTGAGNERGLLNRYQTDYGYRWTTGLSDAAAGEQFYQVLDELNDVYRISIGQYNNGQSSTNNQTVINAAGSGAVVLNGSANSGTGGVIFGAGGSNGATVATINSAGNAQFNGSLQVAGPTTFSSSATVKNQADAEIDSVLWAGATANQKESFIYKDYTGASQWYMVKDASNNWALNSAIGGLDSFKAYQSNNSGDTYINASKSTGHIRLNYETGSGAETDIYGGSSSALVAAFLGSTAIKFPGLAAASAPSCLQIDNSGYISNTGTACGTGASGLDGTVSAGMTGQVAYYAGNGRVLAGMNAVTVSSGGTGASTADEARENLGAHRAMAGVASDGGSGMVVAGNVAAGAVLPGGLPMLDIRHSAFAGGAICNGTTGSNDIGPALLAAYNSLPSTFNGAQISIPDGCWWANPYNQLSQMAAKGKQIISIYIQGKLKIGTTLTVPNGIQVNFYGQNGLTDASFAAPGNTARIDVATTTGNGTGSLGTAITPAYTGTGTPTATTPVVCDATKTGAIYQDTKVTDSIYWTCVTTSGSITASTNTLSVTDTTGFSVGDQVKVPGAGSAGGNLVTQVTAISSISGAGTLTLETNASTTESGASVTISHTTSGYQASDYPSSPGWIAGAWTKFTPSSLSGLMTGAAITVSQACTATIGSISRTSNVVTANVTFPAGCQIPEGVPATVAGVTDSTFNGSHSNGATTGTYLVQSSDYVLNTMQWKQGTAADATSSGGTVLGMNEANIENVYVSHCIGSSCVGTFFRPHASTDMWGLVGVNIANNSQTMTLKDFVIHAPATTLWLPQTYLANIENVSGSTTSGCGGNPSTAVFAMAADVGMSTWIHFRKVAFDSFCAPYSIHEEMPYHATYADSGPLYIDDSFFFAGIKQEYGGMGLFIHNSVCDQCGRGMVQQDPTTPYWNGNVNYVTIDNAWNQDNPNGMAGCYIYQTYPSSIGRPIVELDHVQANNCMVNDYFLGSVRVNGTLGPSYGLLTQRGVVGTYDDGNRIDGEIRGEQAGLGPSLVPYATVNIDQTSSTWPNTCTKTTGILGPDGMNSAIQLSGANYSFETMGFANVTPAVGDMFLAWSWLQNPDLHKTVDASFLNVDNNSSTHFQVGQAPGVTLPAGYTQVNNFAFEASIKDDWWHPVVIVGYVTQSDGTSGQHVRLNSGCSTSHNSNYAKPGMIYIPASGHIPLAEVLRWRTQLLHGFVPPNMPAGGGILAMDATHKLYWGSDTNLYRSGAGALKTDGTLQATGVIAGASGVTSAAASCTSGVPYIRYDGTCGVPAGGGTVTGPGSAVNNNIVLWDGTSGTLIKDSGVTLPANHDFHVDASPISLTGTTSNVGVSQMTVPANRVPANGLYTVRGSCIVAVASAMSASTFNVKVTYFNSANSTEYTIFNGTTASVAAGVSTTVSFNTALQAPASGTGFTATGSVNTSTAFLTGTIYSQASPALISSASNAIYVDVSTSQANATPNTVQCTLTGAVTP